jgi:hypothetical protein
LDKTIEIDQVSESQESESKDGDNSTGIVDVYLVPDFEKIIRKKLGLEGEIADRM